VSFNATFWLEVSYLGLLLTLKERGFLDDEFAQRIDRLNFHCIEASTLKRYPLQPSSITRQHFLNSCLISAG